MQKDEHIAKVELKPFEELRLEVEHSKTILLKITKGFAEIFGSEMAIGSAYKFSGKKLAIYTWHGCSLDVSGECLVQYTAIDCTAMTCFLNTHLILDERRKAAAIAVSNGPRVIVLGQSDVGKTSLCKILLNYGVKMAATPMFIDLDTQEGSVSLPGTISATVIEKPIDPEEEFGSTPGTSNMSALCFYYGYADLTEKPQAFTSQVKKLAELCDKKSSNDELLKSSGYIINSPSQFSQPGGYDALHQCISELSIDTLIILSNDCLAHNLSQKYPREKYTIIHLSASGGVVTRSTAFRRLTQSARVREYFYGSITENGRANLNPHSTTIPFSKITIRRIGDATAAPSSALPLGFDRKARETRMVKVLAGDMLLHSILAASHIDEVTISGVPAAGAVPVEESASSSAEAAGILLASPIAGFYYVSEVDENKSLMTVLAPNSARLIGKVCVMGSLKWVEN